MSAIVVGGTGMLRGFVEELARQGRTVGVVARHTRVSETIPLLADWRDPRAFARILREFAADEGPIDLVVCWMHSDAPEGPRLVADAAPGSRFFQIYGSGAGRLGERWHAHLSRRSDIRYRRIVLGRLRGRWLTHPEICAGVQRAVRDDALDTLVGEPP